MDEPRDEVLLLEVFVDLWGFGGPSDVSVVVLVAFWFCLILSNRFSLACLLILKRLRQWWLLSLFRVIPQLLQWLRLHFHSIPLSCVGLSARLSSSRCSSDSLIDLIILIAAVMSVHLAVGPINMGGFENLWGAQVSFWVFLSAVGVIMRQLLVVGPVSCYAAAGGHLSLPFGFSLGRWWVLLWFAILLGSSGPVLLAVPCFALVPSCVEFLGG